MFAKIHSTHSTILAVISRGATRTFILLVLLQVSGWKWMLRAVRGCGMMNAE